MRWKGGEQSENLEDRRSIGGKGVAMGGGGVLIILLLGWFFGIEPQKLNKLIGQAGVGANPNAAQKERELTPQEKEQREFVATVLKFTEVVWGDQFRRAGQVYEVPHMVLFSNRVQTGCGVAPSAVGPFYCPADKTVYLDPTFFEELGKSWEAQKPSFRRPM